MNDGFSSPMYGFQADVRTSGEPPRDYLQECRRIVDGSWDSLSRAAIDEVRHLSEDQRLSTTALDVPDQVTAKRELIYVPSLCLVEVTYLIEKGRLPEAALLLLLRILRPHAG